MVLRDSYPSLTGARPLTRLDHPPDLVRLTPPHLPSPHIPHPIPESEPLLGADKLVTFSQSFSSVPPHIVPFVKAEPQSPVEEEEPKIAGDLDQEPVKVWGWDGGWPESVSKVDQERQRLGSPRESDI